MFVLFVHSVYFLTFRYQSIQHNSTKTKECPSARENPSSQEVKTSKLYPIILSYYLLIHLSVTTYHKMRNLKVIVIELVFSPSRHR